MPHPDKRMALLSVTWCALLLAAGCGQRAEEGPGFPVAGKVTVDGELLRSGMVLYVPDPQRGNRSSIRSAGPIDEKGVYTLSAEGKRNIPPGYYLVIVQAFEPRTNEGNNRSPLLRGRSLVKPAYGSAATSGLKVEVKRDAGPADYDLHLKH